MDRLYSQQVFHRTSTKTLLRKLLYFISVTLICVSLILVGLTNSMINALTLVDEQLLTLTGVIEGSLTEENITFLNSNESILSHSVGYVFEGKVQYLSVVSKSYSMIRKLQSILENEFAGIEFYYDVDHRFRILLIIGQSQLFILSVTFALALGILVYITNHYYTDIRGQVRLLKTLGFEIRHIFNFALLNWFKFFGWITVSCIVIYSTSLLYFFRSRAEEVLYSVDHSKILGLIYIAAFVPITVFCATFCLLQLKINREYRKAL